MRDDNQTYYDSSEFKELLKSFEDMIYNGGTIYFDGSDIADIADYYTLNLELDKSEIVTDYGLQLHPNNTDILIVKANNLLLKGKKEEAKRIAYSISEEDNQEVLYIKGVIELAYDNIDLAIELFNKAYNISNNDLEMLSDIIIQLMDHRYYNYVQAWIDVAFSISNNKDNTFYELQADLYFETKQFEKAIEWYNKLLDKFPYDVYPWEQLGRIYFEQQEYTKAKECYDYIEAIDGDNFTASLMIADCYINMFDYSTALEKYSILLNKNEEMASVLNFCCGKCCYFLHDTEKAFEYLKKAEQLSDSNDTESFLIELYTLLARLYIINNDEENALQYIYMGLSLDPENEELDLMIKFTKLK